MFGTKLCKDSIKCIRSIGKKINIYRATAKAFSSFFVFIFCSVFANTSLGTHMPCIDHLIYILWAHQKKRILFQFGKYSHHEGEAIHEQQ